MNLISVPAFRDNYIWLLSNKEKQCAIVDPGEASPVIEALAKYQLSPKAILLTHHHNDHVGGVKQLAKRYPEIIIYGPQETEQCGITHTIQSGDTISALGSNFSVFSVPGHTLGHVAYYTHPYLFCGDTLFSAGCGRIFEGTPKQMFESINKIMLLPDDTLICCAHEYTLSNLEFAHQLWPEDIAIKDYLIKVRQMRGKGYSTVPTTLKLERTINLFLRYHDIDLQRKLSINTDIIEDWQIFAQLRDLKDHY
ncbi:hydroxyacylglutathione hydrolase [Pectobacteriaceae bacterium CE90]|nr:hydroxyacylglutathione hydrolase [Pectobacteriaceae bacterium CE90]